MSHSGSWYPVGDVIWDAQGNPYRNTSDGQKDYIPPIVAAQYSDDPKMLAWAKSKGASLGTPTTNGIWNGSTGAPQGGFTGNYTWDSENGGYQKDNLLDSSLGGLLLGGGALAAPFVAGALLPSAATGGGGSAAAAGGSAAALGPESAASLAAFPASLAPPASLAATGAAAGAGAGAAGGGLTLAKTLASLAGPAALLTRTAMGPGSGDGTGVSSLDPNLLAQLSKLIDLSTQRATEAAPVHQAAMALAQRLTPQAQYSAPMSAIDRAATPLPSGNTMSPQVMAAFQKLMAGGH